MNLGQMAEFAESRLRFKPNTAAHRADIRREIAAADQRICGQAPWPFLRTTVAFPMYANEEDVATADFTAAGHLVTLTVGSTDATWLGAYVLAPDGEEYEIAEVPSSSTLKLTTAYAGTTVTDTFTVKYLRYALPADCAGVYSLLDRTNRNLTTRILRAEEVVYPLNDDDASGIVTCIIEKDTTQEYAPLATLVGTLGAGGSLTVGTKYRWLYTYIVAGRESGASNIVEVTPTTGNQTVTLSAIEATTANSGRKKRVYRDSGTGVFQYVTTLAEATASWPDDGLVTPDRTARFEDETAIRRYIRAWGRPSEDIELELQYHRRPRRLAGDTDVPVLPAAYHDIIVDMTVREFKERAGEATGTLDQKIKHRLAELAREFFGDEQVDMRRQGWSPSGNTFGAMVTRQGPPGGARLLP